MATLDELYEALRKADAAGNSSDAKALADSIRSKKTLESNKTQQQKGGDITDEEDQPQADKEGNAQRLPNEQEQYRTQEGVQPTQQRVPQYSKQQVREDDSSDSRSTGRASQQEQVVPSGTKGGDIFDEIQKDAERGQEGQKDGQGIRGQKDAGNEEQVTGKGVQPSPLPLGKQLTSKAGLISGLGTLAESAVELGGGAVAAMAALPLAALAGIPTGGLGGVGVELGAFAAGSELTKQLLVKPIEKAFGWDKSLEEARQQAPKVATAAQVAGMLPFAAKSAAGLLKTAAEAGTEAAIAGESLIGAGLKAVGKKVGIGAATGAAFEPIRYGVEEAAYATGLRSETADAPTVESVLESAGQMGILGGMGAKEKAALNKSQIEYGQKLMQEVGLPETADMAAKLKTDDAIKVGAETKEAAKDPAAPVEDAYALAEDHISVGNRAEASVALDEARNLEESHPVDANTSRNRQKRFEFLDKQIEQLPPNVEEAPLPAKKPAEAPAAEAQQPTLYATETGKVKEGTEGEYPQGDQVREAPKASNRNSVRAAAQGKEEVEGVHPEDLPLEEPSDKGTRVLRAAYRPSEGPNKGKVFYSDNNHTDAMLKSGMTKKEINEKFKNPEDREGPEFGFETNHPDPEIGGFVTRDEAEKIARESGQISEEKAAALDEYKKVGGKIHATDIEMGAAGEGRFGPGASKSSETAIAKHEADLVKASEIHKKLGVDENGDFVGGADYDIWKEQYLKGVKGKKKPTEESLLTLYGESESLAAHSLAYDIPAIESVKNPDNWSNRSIEEIQQSALNKRPTDIKFDNSSIDRSRKSRGLPALMKEASTTFKSHWDEAMVKMNQNRNYQPSLIASLERNVRELSPVDQVVLKHAEIEALAKRDDKFAQANEATDPKMAKRLSIEAEAAEREYLKLSQISANVGSASGTNLGFRRFVAGSEYSLPSLINKAKGMKRRNGDMTDLSEQQTKKLSDLSEAYKKADDDATKSLDASKAKASMRNIMEFVESSSKLMSAIAGEKPLSPKRQITKFLSEVKGAQGDPLSIGVAVRGIARATYERTRNSDPKKILDEVHNTISKYMPDGWTKSQTLDILGGEGVYHQVTKAGANKSIQTAIERTESFNKAFDSALKLKNAKERDAKIAKLLADREVEVHNLHSQVQSHINDILLEANRTIEELNYELRECS